MLKRLVLGVAVIGASLALATPARAVPMLDFGNGGLNGAMRLSSDGSVRGTDAPIGSLFKTTGCVATLGIGVATQNTCSGPDLTLNGFINGRSAFGGETTSPVLLQKLGIAPNTPFQSFGHSLTPGLASSLLARDTSFGPAAVVPEPGSLMLLGTGLFGLASFVRRRSKQRTH